MSRRHVLSAALAACLLAAAPTSMAAADAPLSAQDIATAVKLREAALQPDEHLAWDLTESLTTEVGQRLAGTPEAERGVAWAVAKFKALGYDKVYTEPVTLPLWLRRHEDASVVSPYPQHLVVTALGHSVGTSGPMQGEVVEFADLAALKAAKPGSLDGKIVYISHRMLRSKTGSGYGEAVGARSDGPSAAARLGAKALLIRSIGTDSDRLPHTGMLDYAADAPKIPAAALSNPDADLLSHMLRRGKPVVVKLDLDCGEQGLAHSFNVIGEIAGSDKANEVVTIGGHLDSWDLGTGAIDDASGLAITMAAGALIHRMHLKPHRTIRVIAYMDEESGGIGAKAYADAHAAQVKLHQIGAESDLGADRIYAFHAGVKPSAWPVIEQIGQVLAPLGIVTEKGGYGPGEDPSMMAARGMAWADLSQDATRYFDWHHTANDTLDKIDPAALGQQVAAYAVFAYLSSQAPDSFGSGELPVGKQY
ncbi:MAG: M20/M25/M40 family metallo-hydrolase [Proteobacteria bacterium]|nr:M20/M25/M40 family metallo-hydrolase [Pseudomonadota bacterium]